MLSEYETASGARKISLSRRFFVAFATPLVLLLAVGLLLARQVARMQESAAWVEHSDRVLSNLSELDRRLANQEAALRGYQIAKTPAFWTDHERADLAQVLKKLQDLIADDAKQKERLEEFEQRHAAWLDLARRGALNQTVDVLENMAERKRLADEASGIISVMKETELSLRSQRNQDLSEKTLFTKWAFVILLILIAFTIGGLSRRSLVEITARFNELLDRERSAKRRLETEEWLRSGLLALAESMRGDVSVEQLASRTTAVLAGYIGADAGALFLAESPGLRRIAGYGIDHESAGVGFFAHGEGLLSRAVQSTSVVHLQDLPHSFIKVRAGTGEAELSHLLLSGIRYEGELLGVLELAFFRQPQERAIALFERAGESLGYGLKAALQRMRMRELLEESQRQTEELQTQQEELRVANEELHEQSSALHEAQHQLRDRQVELEEKNASLREQTSYLEDAKRSLQDKNSELERASRYKSEFLANMSHELRTPLNSSLILAKLLADNRDHNLTPEQVRYASTIYSAGNDLLTMINDILDLSKIEAGRLDVHISATPVERLIQPVVTTFEPIIKERNLELAVRLAPELPSAFETDVQRVQQILKNLLSNAAKFTEAGSITLEAEAIGEAIEFRVTDTGIGIAEDQQELIFEAFRQADGTTSRKYGGTGLGLSISRDLARLLGGDLTVHSEPGRGSTFSLRLPKHYAGGAAKRHSAALISPEPSPRPSTPPARPQPSVPPPGVKDDRDSLDGKHRVLLVVEDDVHFAEILVDLAHELEFQCVVAGAAEEGLRLARELSPTAVILDVNLPDRSGLSVLDRLKQAPSTRHIPVHVVSVADYSKQALSMGAIGYMMKPVKREQLTGALRKMEERLTRRVNRVLVVEDDATQRAALCKLLAADDVEAVAVSTVAEALAQLRAHTFDCTVTDLSLPDASGFDFLEQLAADTNHVFPPVIVYTGRSLNDDEEQRLRRYSSAIIVKGARSPERLLDEVTLFLHRVEADLPPERRRMLAQARDREKAFEGRTILVVEDDVRNVFALTSLLEPRGAKVLIARNGRQALEVLAESPKVDLVLMDIMMPEMDGLEATREIRKIPRWRELPVIALTAKAMRDDQRACLQAGANDYIPKPLDVDTLLSVLRVWMRK